MFLCGAALAVLSPIFWMTTRLPEAPQARGYDTAPLYERVYPSVAYSFERLRAGEWPLWNPWALCGTEHLANPVHGVFQPLNLLFFFLPLPAALAAQAFTCALLAGLAFIAFLRALGARYAPAFLGACVYVFSGANAAALSFPEYAAFAVWLPLCFWGVRAVALGQAGASAGLGVVLALAFLSGAVDALLASLLVLLGYGVFLLTTQLGARALGEAARRYRNALLLATALSAVQLLPYLAWAWEHAALWPTTGGELQATLPNSALRLVQQLANVPGVGRAAPLLYFSAGGLIVLPAALFHRQARADVLFFLGAAVACMLLVVYGRSGWDARLPFEAFAFPATLAASVAIAVGADRLFETGRDPRSPNVWIPVLVVVLCGAASFYFLPPQGRGVTFVLFLAAIIPSVIVRLRWLAAGCTVVAALVVYVDLASAMAQRGPHPFSDMPALMAAHAPEFRTAQEQVINGRAILSARPLDPELPRNFGALRELHCAGGGGTPLTPAQRAWWERLNDAAGVARGEAVVSATASQPRLLNYMAVRAAVVNVEAPLLARKWGEGAPRLRPALTSGSLQVLVNDDALPRAYWTPQWRPVDSIESAITLLTSPEFQGDRECVVQGSDSALAALSKLVGGAPAPLDWELVGCSVVNDQPETVTLKVSAPAPGVTILADTFASGWRATLDGKSVPILRVNGLFRGVATPAGDHEIVFTYRPWSFYLGGGVSGFSGLLLLAWGVLRPLWGVPLRK